MSKEMTKKPAKTKCPECKKEILWGIEKCPHCGKQLKDYFMGWNVISVIIVGVIVFAVFSGVRDAFKTTNTDTLKPKTAQEQTVQKTEDIKPKTTNDRLWDALDVSIKTRDGYEISYDEQEKYVVLKRSPKDTWDETTFVRGGINTLIKYSKEVFRIDGVNKVEVVLFKNFTDSYGKQEVEKGLSISITKEEFQKYNWDNLKYQPIYWKLSESSGADYYIHPAVYKNLKTDKVYYEG